MKDFLNIKMAGFALLLSVFSLNISAQGPGGGPGRGRQITEEDIKERVERTAETLKLKDAEHKKILAIDMDFYNKMQIEREKMMKMERTPENRDLIKEKMTKMRDERNKQYKEVLSPEKYEQFVEMEEQRRSEMQKKRRENSEGGEERSARGRGRN